MDEPAAGLPEAEVPEFAAVVRAVRDDHGAGVLLIDHNMALIMDVCDRIHVLDQGATLAEGAPGEIRANLDVAAAYLGESAVREDDAMSARDARDRRARRQLRRRRGRARPLDRGRQGRDRGPDRARTARASRRRCTRSWASSARAAARSGSRASRCAAARPSRSRAPGISLVPEGRRIFADLTVEENLRLGLSGRRSRAGAAEDIEAVYAQFPIVKEFGRRRAGALSGGQQQQLAIARALVAGPDVLLLDEPSLGLAPKIVDVVFEALAEIRERGITVLLVEQRAQRTVAFADRTYLMANGEIRLTMTPADADDTDNDGGGLPLVNVLGAPRSASINAQVIVDAIGLGATYALMAVGIGLVFGVLRLVNFAYGQLIMAGAYTLAYTSDLAACCGASSPASRS